MHANHLPYNALQLTRPDGQSAHLGRSLWGWFRLNFIVPIRACRNKEQGLIAGGEQGVEWGGEVKLPYKTFTDRTLTKQDQHGIHVLFKRCASFCRALHKISSSGSLSAGRRSWQSPPPASWPSRLLLGVLYVFPLAFLLPFKYTPSLDFSLFLPLSLLCSFRFDCRTLVYVSSYVFGFYFCIFWRTPLPPSFGLSLIHALFVFFPAFFIFVYGMFWTLFELV